MTERDLLVLQLAELRGHDTTRGLDSIGSHLESLHKLADEILARKSRIIAGRYELLEKVGEGGMAVVFKARDLKLNRIVALKGLERVDATEVERFRREARLAAQLRHPNIVEVYDLVEETDQVFISMQYIEGRTLASGGRPLKESLKALAQAADALEQAHRDGILHRDVKPDNILVDGEGRAWLSDFGLARRQKSGTRLTQTGLVLGTPGYMAPEQALAAEVDAQSDVYGLGATLYEILAGAPPFTGSSAFEVLDAVVKRDPVAPRGPEGLRVICLKALSKRKKDRYSSAAEFAAEVRRFLRGEPILARPPGAVARALRWTRRHPARLAVVLTVVLCVAGVGLGFGFMRSRTGDREESDRRMRHGMQLVDENRLEEAAACFESAAAADASYALPRVWLGRTHALLKNTVAARRAYDEAIRIDPTSSEAYFWRGSLTAEEYYASRKAAQVIYSVEGVIVVPPRESPAGAELRERAQSDIEKSLELWRRASGEDLPEFHHSMGLISAWKGEYEAAVIEFENYLATRPYDGLGHERLAVSLFYGKRFDIALASFREAVRLRGDSPDFATFEAMCRYASAIEAAARHDDPRPGLGEGLKRVEGVDRWRNAPALLIIHASLLERMASWEAESGGSPEELFVRALDSIERALKVSPDAPYALLMAGKILLERIKWARDRGGDFEKDYEQGLAVLTRALEADPKDYHALTHRAYLHGAAGAGRPERRKLAIEDLDRVIADHPDDITALAKRGRLRVEAGDAEGIRDLDRAVALGPKSPGTLIDRAAAHIHLAKAGGKDEDFARALSDCDAAEKLDPKESEAFVFRAYALYYRSLRGTWDRGGLERSAAAARRAVLLNAGDSTGWSLLSMALVKIGVLTEFSGEDSREILREAVQAAEKGARLSPGMRDAVHPLADARAELWRAGLRRGDPGEAIWKSAIEGFTESLRLASGDVEALVGRANLRSEMAKMMRSVELLPSAIRDYDDAEKIAPDRWEIYNGRGLALGLVADARRDEKTYLRAIEDLKKAVRLGPRLAPPPSNLAGLEYGYGRFLISVDRDPSGPFADSLEHSAEALRRDASYVRAYTGRAYVFYARSIWLQKQGKSPEPDIQSAIAECDRAIKINSKYDEAFHVRGRCHYDLGHRAEARADFRRALELNPRLKGAIETYLRELEKP